MKPSHLLSEVLVLILRGQKMLIFYIKEMGGDSFYPGFLTHSTSLKKQNENFYECNPYQKLGNTKSNVSIVLIKKRRLT